MSQESHHYDLLFLGVINPSVGVRKRTEDILVGLCGIQGRDLPKLFENPPVVVRRSSSLDELHIYRGALETAGARVQIVTAPRPSDTSKQTADRGTRNQDITASDLKPEELFYSGVEQMMKGRNEEAIKTFQRALSIVPDFSEVHLNLGNVYYNVEAFPQALEHYRQFVRLKPERHEGHQNIGNLFLKLEMYADAAAAYKSAIKVNPKNAELFLTLGYVQSREGKDSEALVSLKTALELDPANVNARELFQSLQNRDTSSSSKPPLKSQESKSHSSEGIAIKCASMGQFKNALKWLGIFSAEGLAPQILRHEQKSLEVWVEETEPLARNNMPEDIHLQCADLARKLAEKKCVHHDIQPRWLSVKEGRILLSGFQFAGEKKKDLMSLLADDWNPSATGAGTSADDLESLRKSVSILSKRLHRQFLLGKLEPGETESGKPYNLRGALPFEDFGCPAASRETAALFSEIESHAASFVGKSVLDIGSPSLYFAFASSLRGAKRVTRLEPRQKDAELFESLREYYELKGLHCRLCEPDALDIRVLTNTEQFDLAIISWANQENMVRDSSRKADPALRYPLVEVLRTVPDIYLLVFHQLCDADMMDPDASLRFLRSFCPFVEAVSWSPFEGGISIYHIRSR